MLIGEPLAEEGVLLPSQGVVLGQVQILNTVEVEVLLSQPAEKCQNISLGRWWGYWLGMGFKIYISRGKIPGQKLYKLCVSLVLSNFICYFLVVIKCSDFIRNSGFGIITLN